MPPSIPPELRDGQFIKPYEMETHDHQNNVDKQQYFGPRPGDRNEYAHIWEMPLPQPKSSGSYSTEGGDRHVISPYEYRSSLPPGNYGTAVGHVVQGYGNNTLARREHDYEISENGDDPRYFQLDPDGGPISPEHQ